MIFSNGFIYRWGVGIKETGEKMAHIKLFGIPVLRPFCGPVINLGNRIRDWVLDRPIEKRDWRYKRQMKKNAVFIIDSLDRLCAKHSGNGCKDCPVMGGCKDFLRLLSFMSLSIRTGENLLRPMKREKPV